MEYTVIDFETVDPYIELGLGSGWIYGIKDNNSEFKVLGAAFYKSKTGESFYETNPKRIIQEAKDSKILVMHNAQYDLGCLRYLGLYLSDHTIVDTLIAAKLFDSSLPSFSLDSLCNRYFRKSKAEDCLAEAVWKHNLYPWLKRELKEKERVEKSG